MSILVASHERTTSTTKTFTYNTASQLTNTGYVYDGLGRNTSIPASHSPGAGGVIGLSYRLNDQVASITQNSVTTVYGFDAAGRRVTETSAGSVLTKHYTGTSDNPAWSSNNAGVSDIYTSSLGTGLNSTVHVDNGVKTVSLDVNDMRGNTVTRINLDTASTDSWIGVDEYGNRDNASTGKLVTYDAYGQCERATTSQGLILMGARVYNPVTNQFTSPDPVAGGNETPYTYPNDPINKTDFDGLLQLSSDAMSVIEFSFDAAAWLTSRAGCFTMPGLCPLFSAAFGVVANVFTQVIDLAWGPKSRTRGSSFSATELLVSGIVGALGSFLSPGVTTLLRKKLSLKLKGKTMEFLIDKGISFVLTSVLTAIAGEDDQRPANGNLSGRKTYIGQG